MKYVFIALVSIFWAMLYILIVQAAVGEWSKAFLAFACGWWGSESVTVIQRHFRKGEER